MPNAAVTIFNTNQVGISLSVNNGAQFQIDGTGPGQGWQPQQPANNPVSFSGRQPMPNVLGTGQNNIHLSISGSPRGVSFVIHIPGNQQILSLQIYFFLNQMEVSWVVLNNGPNS